MLRCRTRVGVRKLRTCLTPSRHLSEIPHHTLSGRLKKIREKKWFIDPPKWLFFSFKIHFPLTFFWFLNKKWFYFTYIINVKLKWNSIQASFLLLYKIFKYVVKLGRKECIGYWVTHKKVNMCRGGGRLIHTLT